MRGGSSSPHRVDGVAISATLLQLKVAPKLVKPSRIFYSYILVNLPVQQI